jgi:Cu2+-exporting ATPase
MNAPLELDRGLPSVVHAPPAESCAHCGLPVPACRVESSPGAVNFCCDGCASVHAVLHAAGLEAYYDRRSHEFEKGQKNVQPSRGRFEEFDDPSFRQQHCRSQGRGIFSAEFVLEGIHCSACIWLVERLSRVEPSVVEARFDMTRSVLEISWDDAQAPLSAALRALASLGYHPHAASSPDVGRARRSADRALLLRLGVAGAAAGNVMLMALALYAGEFSGMTGEYRALFRWGSLLLATPSVFWSGAVFFRGAVAALRTRTPHMDLPVSIGILAGYAGSTINTLRGRGEIFFDTLCTLVFLLLVGRYLQRTHQRGSVKASELINALAPSTAHTVEGAQRRDVPAPSLKSDAVVEIFAGERVPADGVVLAGSSSVDTSLLTGEPVPQEVAVGDRVYAGTTNETATLRVRVESAGSESRLGRLMQSVEATQRQRTPIVRLADRVAGYFVLAILALAALTLGVWLYLDPSVALDHTVALLVVTCPCALGMATPLAISAALGQAARAGVLFKGGEFVEELAQPGVLVFDKTGTLTTGRLELVDWLGDASLKPLVRAAEAKSGHPIARALQRAIPENDLLVADVEDAVGYLRARVEERKVLIGSPATLRQSLGSLPLWAETAVANSARAGRTPVLVAVDGALMALAAFADQVRPNTAKSLRRLRSLGFQVQVLSGDQQGVVDEVVRELAVPFEEQTGNADPEMKLATIQALRQRGKRVFMVGDGVNDAAAMAAANVGIAVHGGAEACLAAADVFTTRSGLEPLVVAAEGSRRTLRVIRAGIGLSLVYNLLGIGCAASGVLSPLLAAILMPLSSITVVSLALRARTFSGLEAQ